MISSMVKRIRNEVSRTYLRFKQYPGSGGIYQRGKRLRGLNKGEKLYFL